MAKNSPNLRDFRIDASKNSSGRESSVRESSLSESSGKDSSPHQAPKQVAKNVPQQTISSRATTSVVGATPQSSVSEWGSQSWQGQERGDLWQVWEEDQEFQNASSGTNGVAVRQHSIDSNTHSGEKALKISSTSAPAFVTSSVASSTTGNSFNPNQTNANKKVAPATEEPAPLNNPPAGFLAWPAELALEERKMERLGVVDFSNSFKKADLLKRLTREFVKNLRETFQREIEVFNSVRQSQSHFIHLYRVSNTEEDFMLFRNGVKLVVSGERSGHIVLAFNQFLGQIFTPSQQQPTFELDATWGAFDQIHWIYRGERVNTDDIVRFFLGEFTRQSYK